MGLLNTRPELGYEYQKSKYYLRIRSNFFECSKEKNLDESLLSLLEEQVMKMNAYEQRKIDEFSGDLVFWEWFNVTKFG